MINDITIMARFIGKDSCGFKHGKVYNLHYKETKGRLHVHDNVTLAYCPYGSWNAF